MAQIPEYAGFASSTIYYDKQTQEDAKKVVQQTEEKSQVSKELHEVMKLYEEIEKLNAEIEEKKAAISGILRQLRRDFEEVESYVHEREKTPA